MSDQDPRNGVSVTLKGGQVDPWIVFHGENIEGVSDELEKLELDPGTMKAVATLAVGFHKAVQNAKGTLPANPNAGAPPPANAGPSCSKCGAVTEYKAKPGERGWHGNFCTADKDHVDWLPIRK